MRRGWFFRQHETRRKRHGTRSRDERSSARTRGHDRDGRTALTVKGMLTTASRVRRASAEWKGLAVRGTDGSRALRLSGGVSRTRIGLRFWARTRNFDAADEIEPFAFRGAEIDRGDQR